MPKPCLSPKALSAVCIFVSSKVTAEMIDRLRGLGVGLIALRSAGYNHVDIQAARNKIKVVRVPSYSPYSVAEFAVGELYNAVPESERSLLASERTRKDNFSIAGLMGFDMHGKTAGVIGCGQIGSVIVRILKGFGMRVLGYDIEKPLVEKAGAHLCRPENSLQRKRYHHLASSADAGQFAV